MSCAVGSTWPSGGRRSTHSCVAVADGVREVRAAARDQRRVQRRRRSRPRRARRTTARRRSRSTPGGVVASRARETTERTCGPESSRARSASRDCGVRGRDGLAVAAGVAGDAADGHVDAEAGGGALFLGLAAPEAVLAVLAGPVAALDAAPGTRGTRRGPAPRARRGPRGARRPARRTARVWPSHAASSVQVSGPVKIRLETVSAAMGSSCERVSSGDSMGRSPGAGGGTPAPRARRRTI